MQFLHVALLSALGLTLVMIGGMEVGRRIGRRTHALDPEGAQRGTGGVDAAVFGLFGLLLAFTFSSGAARYEGRRDLITEEANAIGTAYLRIDVLPPDTRAAMRELFKEYTTIRAGVYRKANDTALLNAESERAAKLQEQIWNLATGAVQRPDAMSAAPMLVLPALNTMFDITTSRNAELYNHPPLAIYALFFVLSMVVSLLIGYNQGADNRRKWLHTFVYTAVVAFTFYVIIDLEFPRFGLIRVDKFDVLLFQLRDSMK